MSASLNSSLRRYKHLPVYIEEDHNDVVPHIHRAIASRHLPMSGIALVHFDSHPDLLLPLHLQADDVFSKEKMYSELSIENWILPLAYAGHISDIYWLKPPWADQLSNVSHLKFSVGKWKETGEIRCILSYENRSDCRTTLTDPYFLTEALYAPESQLINMKPVTLHVITIKPDNWTFDAAGSDHDLCSEGSIRSSCVTQNLTNTVGSLRSVGSQGCESNTQPHCPSSKVPQENSSKDAKQDCKDLRPSLSKFRKIDEGIIAVGKNEQEFAREADQQFGDGSSAIAAGEGKSIWQTQPWLVELGEKLKKQPFILDIDLDFFSTKDPFRNEFALDQSALLQQLFQFQLPTVRSEQSLLEFCKSRQVQLDELREIFGHLHQNPESKPSIQDPQKQDVLGQLIQSLQLNNSRQTPIDFEMLYHAGCIFDGSALPHHVSSPQQIQELMDFSALLLRNLSPPTLITIARSSVDDYCPKEQVDTIQEAMIKIVTDLYKDIEVKKLYE